MNKIDSKYFLLGFFLTLICQPTQAGFLEMPDLSEVPSFERQSMVRDLDIPSVRDRNPDPEAGPRLAVSSFRLQGIVEFPELGITKADLDKMIEQIRHDAMAEDMLLESGYTQEEIGEISDMLVEIDKETTDRHVSTLEVQKLVWLVRDQRSRRGITLGQIEAIADKITMFYRERGFILAKAYIPKQEVRGGIVSLTLLLGLLGEVESLDNKMYSDDILLSVFDDDLTKPVTNAVIEENLYLINDYPGINVQGYFEPGAQVGDTKLNIKVNDETRYNGNIRLDNHGTEETGKQRLYSDILINNSLGNADKLHISLLYSSSPDNTTYYQIRYNTHVYSPRINLDLSTTTNQFILDQDADNALSAIDLSGDTEQTSIASEYKLKRSRTRNHILGLKLENIVSDLTFGSIDNDFFDSELENTSIYYNFDILYEKEKALHQGSIKLSRGEFISDPIPGQDEEYSFLNVDYTYLSFWKIPFTDSNSRIIFRTATQFTGDALSSINQFSLAGATRAKGFIPNLFSTDSAIYLGFEWIFNSPNLFDFKLINDTKLSEIAQPYFFADASYGIKRSLALDEEDAVGRIANLGLGLRFSYLNDFKGNIQFAFPVDDKFENTDIIEVDDSVRVVFDFQYSFL